MKMIDILVPLIIMLLANCKSISKRRDGKKRRHITSQETTRKSNDRNSHLTADANKSALGKEIRTRKRRERNSTSTKRAKRRKVLLDDKPMHLKELLILDKAKSQLYEEIVSPNDRDMVRVLTAQLPHLTGDFRVDDTVTACHLLMQSKDLNAAENIFGRVLSIDRLALSALIGLSNLYSSSNRHEEAIQMLTSYLTNHAYESDILMLRADVFANLGRAEEALSDLDRALSLSPLNPTLLEARARILMQTGEFAEASSDFSTIMSLNFDQSSPSLASEKSTGIQMNLIHYYLCDAYQTLGYYDLAQRAVDAALNRFPKFRPLWLQKIRVLTSAANWKEAIATATHVLDLDPDNEEVLRLRGSILRMIGSPRAALADFERALALLSLSGHDDSDATLLSARQDALSQSALCLVALGRLGEAVRRQGDILRSNPEHKVWYSREVTAYWWERLDSDFATFNVNREIHPLVRGGFLNETQRVVDVTSSGYESLTETVPDVTRRSTHSVTSLASPEALRLLELTSDLGKWVQLDCEGFMPSVRQHRQFGLAVLEMAQTLRRHVSLLREGGRGLQVPDTASSRDPSQWSSEAKSGCAEGYHWLSYRDLMDIAVRWRQLADPGDNVFWFEFRPRTELGYMLSTPLLHGDIEIYRYSTVIPTTLSFLTQALEGTYYVGDDIFEARPQRLNATQRARLRNVLESARSSDGSRASRRQWSRGLFEAVGQGYWAIARVRPMVESHLPLEGARVVHTQLTTKKQVLSVRVPSSAERMVEFEAELEAALQRLVAVLTSEGEESVRREGLGRHALELFYYWANFAPLTRGTAATGYALLLSSLLAGGYSVGGRMPKQRQLDWEAIFTPEPEDFIVHGQTWLQAIVPTTLQQIVLDGREGYAVADVISTPAAALAVLGKVTFGRSQEEELPFINAGVLLDQQYVRYLAGSAGGTKVRVSSSSKSEIKHSSSVEL